MVIPWTPAPLRASLTSSSLKGLTIAVTSFTALPSGHGRVGGFGMLAEVETLDLSLLVDSEADGEIDHLGDHKRQHEREYDRGTDGHGLVAQQRNPAAEEQPPELLGREQAEQKGTRDAADEVNGDHVERVVEPEGLLDAERQVAHDTGNEADGDRREPGDKAGARGDGDQAGDHTG